MDFYREIRCLVDELGLSSRVFVGACRVCDRLRGRDGFRYLFTRFDGYSGLVAASVLLAGRRLGVPLSAGLVERVSGVDGLGSLCVDLRRELGWSRVFFTVREFTVFYLGFLDFDGEGVSQGFLCEELCLSSSSLSRVYRRVVCFFTGVESGRCVLDELEVGVESFGFFPGDDGGFEEFAVFLAERVDGEDVFVDCSESVLAAACVYVSGKLLL